jgi:PPK2 family polyphosphate:nucleotide phosphotransferase
VTSPARPLPSVRMAAILERNLDPDQVVEIACGDAGLLRYRLRDVMAVPGEPFALAEHDPDFAGDTRVKAEALERVAANASRLGELQEKLWAQDTYALLVIFQGIDAAGKDGAIRHVMRGVNPQGCNVTSFKEPSAEELDHDYLWRAARALPARGTIGIFNRSYYEEVLVVRVHPELLQRQKLPPEGLVDVWRNRFEEMNHFEEHLERNGTVVLKFFLNLSKKEQKKRFLKRIDEPEKNWKFSVRDFEERKHWDDYQAAYQDMLRSTSTVTAPWFVIPSDDKWFARLVISETICMTLERLKLEFPKLDPERLAELKRIRKVLAEE